MCARARRRVRLRVRHVFRKTKCSWHSPFLIIVPVLRASDTALSVLRCLLEATALSFIARVFDVLVCGSGAPTNGGRARARQVAESFLGLVRRSDMDSLKFADQRYIIFDAAAIRVQASRLGVHREVV